MKLVVMTPDFVKEQTKKVKPLPPPSITFCHNMIRLNRQLVEALNLKEGDEVILVQDDERPKDFHLVPFQGGYPIRAGSNGEFRLNCVYYWHKIKMALDIDGKAIKFKVATTPAKLNTMEGYAILTVDPLPFAHQKGGKKSSAIDAKAYAQASNL